MGRSDLLAAAEDQGLAHRHRAAEDEAVDMGVGEAQGLRREQVLDQERLAQAPGVIALEVVGCRPVEHAHRHAAASSAST